MRNFSGGGSRRGGFRGGNGGSRPNYSNKGWDGGRDRDSEASMHHATCSECGNDCQVPFRPTGSKPVYCNDCFGSKKGANRDRDFGGRPARRDFDNKLASVKQVGASDDIKKQLAEINTKIDRLFTMIEKLTQTKIETVKVEKIVSEDKQKEDKKLVPAKAVKAKTATKKVATKKTATKSKK